MEKEAFLGIDTSNYTTSCALLASDGYFNSRRLLPVEDGSLGLRQSEAVFSHIKSLGGLFKELMEKKEDYSVKAVGVSAYPRDCDGSYMPCFLVGKMAAESIAAALHIPVYYFSHQAGHIAAAAYSAGCTDLLKDSFAAFHISGGTTECVMVNDLKSGDIKIISCSNDLNAGQVIDRCANMLSLSFPGGRQIDALSLKSTKKFKNRIKMQGGNPCFSGVENQCRDMLARGCAPCDIARFCLDSVSDGIKGMIDFAKTNYHCKEFLFAGGVAANTILRKEISAYCSAHFASLELSGDNAVGASFLAMKKFKEEV